MDTKINDVKERLFDELLKIAARDAMHREMDAEPGLDELNVMYPRSKAVDNKVYAAISRHEKAEKIKKSVRVFSRVAAVFCIVIVLGGSLLYSVEASRNFIRNLLIDVREDHVVLDFGYRGAVAATEKGLTFGYFPEGFELVDAHILEAFNKFLYTNESGDMIIVEHYLSSSQLMAIDNELRQFSIGILNEKKAFFFKSLYDDAHNQIVWEYGEEVISVSTNLPMDILIKIAENISVE